MLGGGWKVDLLVPTAPSLSAQIEVASVRWRGEVRPGGPDLYAETYWLGIWLLEEVNDFCLGVRETINLRHEAFGSFRSAAHRTNHQAKLIC